MLFKLSHVQKHEKKLRKFRLPWGPRYWNQENFFSSMFRNIYRKINFANYFIYLSVYVCVWPPFSTIKDYTKTEGHKKILLVIFFFFLFISKKHNCWDFGQFLTAELCNSKIQKIKNYYTIESYQKAVADKLKFDT